MKALAVWCAKRYLPELLRAKAEAEHLRRITAALAHDISLSEMASLVAEECKMALDADATCVFMLDDEGEYVMLAERGCTQGFKTEWKHIPKEILPHLGLEHPNEMLFIGSAQELQRSLECASRIIAASGRHTIAYASLVVNGRPIGLLGFSYNQAREQAIDPTFVLTIIGFCAQALERVRLTEREQLARQHAESANHAKTEFLANVSHEIRTPIGVIQGFADLLLESNGLTATQSHWAEVIRRNTQQLTGLVGEVLDISKIEAEKIEIEAIEFSLKELLEDVRTTAEFKAREKGIQLLFECDPGPEWIRSDPTRLRQVLVNLVGNAIKFTVDGYVKVRVSHSPAGHLEVEVCDTGIGISHENQSTVFEPFIQADTSTRRRFGGTGLGLTIAKRLAQALGGDVTLKESVPGKGSIFFFHMPCERVDSPDFPIAAGDGADRRLANKGGNLELAGLKILLVEDSLDNQDLICSILAREGASVEVADSGVVGVEKALAQHYNVVLMDIQMPGLDGHQAVAQLRSRGYNRPIAALMAHVLSSERQKSLREGFDDYLTKPIDRMRLIRSLKRLAFLGAS